MAAVDVLELYDKLRLAPDEEARARLIAQAFSLLEARYPHLDDLVTTRELSTSELKLIKEIELVRGEIKETELRLVKEIEAVRAETEKVRGEIKETELRLVKEIEAVRGEIKETELRLVKEIESVRAEIEKVRGETEKVRGELKETELRLVKEIESVRAETEKVRAELKVDIARSHAGLLKWSFLFWASQLGALLLLFWRLTGKG